MQQRESRTSVTNSLVQLQRGENVSDYNEYSVINVSRGGLCFESGDAYELNEVVQVNVVIDQQAIHFANARICYRDNADKHSTAHYGLSFLDRFIDADLIRRKNKASQPGQSTRTVGLHP
ncbi:hypothetical protein MNBD_GAMMA10-1046 [hydrothermal vent metagenome]|uniref:PilZ domain-containing protein n=1 Tax=hydrothermal vent metagenome TaxID=652676 RepID=A0A3B0Y9K0_9ZZZZ